MFDSDRNFSKAGFWDTCFGDNFFKDSIPEKNPPHTAEKQCQHGYPGHIFVNQFWNPNDKLRYEQHVLIGGLSATNTHPDTNECHFNDEWVSNTWKLLISRGIIFGSKWSHSLYIMELVKGSLVVKCVGKDHDYEFDAETKTNVYKKEEGWQMLSALGFARRLYLRSSLPRLVEIQLMNAVMLHHGREIAEDGNDGDSKEV